MHSSNKLIFSLIFAASVLIATRNARAQTNLGWHTFDYGVSGDLGATVSLFDGALQIRARSGIASLLDCSGSLFEGSAANVHYLHDENWLVGGIATSSEGTMARDGLAEELLFEFNGSARLDSLAFTMSSLTFGAGTYDASGFNQSGDDPLLWFNTNQGLFSISEKEISEVTSFFIDGTTAGAESGYVDLAYFTPRLGVDTLVSSFGLRETMGQTWVKDIYVGEFYFAAPVPEPGSLFLVGLGILIHLRRRRTVALVAGRFCREPEECR